MMNERFIKAANSKNAYVCDESLHQLVGVLHVRHDHEEIIVGGSQQIRTEYDGQCVCRHLVVLLVVCDPRIRFVREVYQQVKQIKSLVKVLNNTFQNIKIMSRQSLDYCPYSLYPAVEVLDFCEK